MVNGELSPREFRRFAVRLQMQGCIQHISVVRLSSRHLKPVNRFEPVVRRRDAERGQLAGRSAAI